MDSRREQVWVGTFVLAAAAVAITVVIVASGAFTKTGVAHRSYFKFAGGLAPAAPVRFGGLQVGRVEALRVNKQDSTRIEIEFSVAPGVPVKTDSLAKISFLGALGESYLEITTGSRNAPLAPAGSVINSREMVAIGDIADMISGLAPTAEQVLKNLDERITELKLTIANVNDLLGDQNRQNISASLSTLNGMLAESRPKVSATLTNIHAATEKLPPVMDNVHAASDKLPSMLDDLRTTINQANQTLANVDSLVAENRPDLRAAMVDVRKTLRTASEMIEKLKNTSDRNSDNLDETLINVRDATGNMRELSDTLKRNPSVLIRGEMGKDRRPGDRN